MRTLDEIGQAILQIEEGIEKDGDSGQARSELDAMWFAYENYDLLTIKTVIENESRFGEETYSFFGGDQGFSNQMAYLDALRWVIGGDA